MRRTTTVSLAHIPLERNHRLSHVKPWAEKRLESLQACIGQTVRALGFSNDRLGDVLRALSQDDARERLEATLNGHLLPVYHLYPQRVPLDSTTASSSCSVMREGLFQLGHSKDHRPDLPQMKVMLATLDPLGMPLATMVLPGQRADNLLYIPAITQVHQGLGRRGPRYIGDCEMGAPATRGFLQAGGDFYLCPFSEIQMPTHRGCVSALSGGVKQGIGDME
jgi:transposase